MLSKHLSHLDVTPQARLNRAGLNLSPLPDALHFSLWGKGRVVGEIVDLEDFLETTGRVLELVQMEGLGLVELVAVGRADLVRVLVRLSPPGCAVPQLSVAFIPRNKCGTVEFDLEERGRIKFLRVIAGPEVGLVMHAWGLVAHSERGVGVFFCALLHVGSSFFVGAAAESSACSFQSRVNDRDIQQAKPKEFNGY